MNTTDSLQFKNSIFFSPHTCPNGTTRRHAFAESSRWRRVGNYGKNFTLNDRSNLSLCVFAAVMLLEEFMSDIAPVQKIFA